MKIDIKHKKNFLICIDSDGCAMNTMDVKHLNYFGPLAAKFFNINDCKTFLDKWNQINLYSNTRGINRFKGLVLGLQDAIERGEKIEDISNLIRWTETTKELSNSSLELEIEKNKTNDLIKTLEWSQSVNNGIEELVGKDSPFPNVKKHLEELHKVANIAVVSSANSQAIYSEWSRHELLNHVDIVFGQEAGTKAICIKKLKDYGYNNNNILMIGDAPGDLEAALLNNVFFFPILFGKEEESWNELTSNALNKFINNLYLGEYQNNINNNFKRLLNLK